MIFLFSHLLDHLQVGSCGFHHFRLPGKVAEGRFGFIPLIFEHQEDRFGKLLLWGGGCFGEVAAGLVGLAVLQGDVGGVEVRDRVVGIHADGDLEHLLKLVASGRVAERDAVHLFDAWGFSHCTRWSGLYLSAGSMVFARKG